jgi:hypothetical protein
MDGTGPGLAEHFGHLALKVRITPFQVIAYPMRLEFAAFQNAPGRGLAYRGQA